MTIRNPEDVIESFNFEGFDPALLKTLYLRMVRAREFEEKLYYLFLTIKMPGTMHQATGQEAVAVGVASALNTDDYVTSTHRGHAHCIAKDVSEFHDGRDVREAQRRMQRHGRINAFMRLQQRNAGRVWNCGRGHTDCHRRCVILSRARNEPGGGQLFWRWRHQ